MPFIEPRVLKELSHCNPVFWIWSEKLMEKISTICIILDKNNDYVKRCASFSSTALMHTTMYQLKWFLVLDSSCFLVSLHAEL